MRISLFHPSLGAAPEFGRNAHSWCFYGERGTHCIALCTPMCVHPYCGHGHVDVQGLVGEAASLAAWSLVNAACLIVPSMPSKYSRLEWTSCSAV